VGLRCAAVVTGVVQAAAKPSLGRATTSVHLEICGLIEHAAYNKRFLERAQSFRAPLHHLRCLGTRRRVMLSGSGCASSLLAVPGERTTHRLVLLLGRRVRLDL